VASGGAGKLGRERVPEGQVEVNRAARAQAWQATERQYAAAPTRRSGTPTSQNQRTALPYSFSWSIAWLAPVLLSSGGRSAVSTSSGMPDSSASITAG